MQLAVTWAVGVFGWWCLPGVASASQVWLGGSGNYETPTNWSGGTVPGVAQDASIPSGEAVFGGSLL